MELSAETIAHITRRWASTAYVALATHDGGDGDTPRLYTLEEMFKPSVDKELFDFPTYTPMTGGSHLLTLDELAVRVFPSVAGQPPQVLTAVGLVEPPDSGAWLFGATLANSGLSLAVLRALTVMNVADRCYAEMRTAYKLGGGDTPLRHRQYNWLRLLQEERRKEEPHRLALHAYVASRLSAA